MLLIMLPVNKQIENVRDATYRSQCRPLDIEYFDIGYIFVSEDVPYTVSLDACTTQTQTFSYMR